MLKGPIPLDVVTKELGGVPLSQLEELVSAATGGKLSMRKKSMTVLGRLRGFSGASVCCFLHVSKQTSVDYWKRFLEGGPQSLFATKSAKTKKSGDESKRAVFASLHSPPAAHNINRTTWRMVDLHKILSEQHQPLSKDVIRRVIKEAGYKWRRARVVLTSKDPDYRTKLEAIKKILSELRPDKAFFSIDEFGPFAVKQKGGIKRVAPGEQYVVPQWQKSKGWMILTAALELSRNQVSHFYSFKKNTDEMIKMADLLRDFWANQLRVLLTAAAYVLMQELRLRAAGTDCARAQVWTLRERLLKLGARVLVSVRRVVVHLPASFPFLSAFWRVALALGASPG